MCTTEPKLSLEASVPSCEQRKPVLVLWEILQVRGRCPLLSAVLPAVYFMKSCLFYFKSMDFKNSEPQEKAPSAA